MQGMRVSWLAHLGRFLQKHVFSFGREEILPRNFKKSDKIDCQKPGAELRSSGLGSPNLDKSSQPEPKPSAITKNEKGAFPCKRGTFEGTEGRFLEISSTKIVKHLVFH